MLICTQMSDGGAYRAAVTHHYGITRGAKKGGFALVALSRERRYARCNSF